MLHTESVEMHSDFWVEDLLLSSSSDSERALKAVLFHLLTVAIKSVVGSYQFQILRPIYKFVTKSLPGGLET